MKRTSTQYPGIYYREREKGRVYEIAYTDALGKRVFKTVAGGLRDAQRERANILRRQGQGEKIVATRITVKELAELYLREVAPLKCNARTLETYGDNVDTHIVPKLGRKRVADLDVDAVAQFIGELKKTHSPWTIHGILSPLSRMMAYAVRRGWASANPVAALDKDEKPSGFKRKLRILSSEEIELALEHVTDRWRPFLLTAIFTGLRISELIELRWDDVDREAKLLRVRGTKTEAAVREVTLPDFLLQELAKLQLAAAPGQELVFVTASGGRLNRRNAARGALTMTLERAKLPHCRFHDLRHTFASILIGQGEDVTYVADQLGHSSPMVTLGIYAKLFDPKARREAARERMQERFGGLAQ